MRALWFKKHLQIFKVLNCISKGFPRNIMWHRFIRKYVFLYCTRLITTRLMESWVAAYFCLPLELHVNTLFYVIVFAHRLGRPHYRIFVILQRISWDQYWSLKCTHLQCLSSLDQGWLNNGIESNDYYKIPWNTMCWCHFFNDYNICQPSTRFWNILFQKIENA